MTDERLAWLAGLFEGEGTCSFRTTSRTDGGRSANRIGGSLRLEINMTDADVLAEVRRVTRAGRVYGPYDRGSGRRPMYMWVITSPSAARALAEQLRPLLFARRRDQVDRACAQYDSRYRRCGTCEGRRFQCQYCYRAWVTEANLEEAA